jgi:hypothetical protein
MNGKRFLCLCAGIALFLASGCAGSSPLIGPLLKRSDPDADTIKDYQSLTLTKQESANSGVRLVAGCRYDSLVRLNLAILRK